MHPHRIRMIEVDRASGSQQPAQAGPPRLLSLSSPNNENSWDQMVSNNFVTMYLI